MEEFELLVETLMKKHVPFSITTGVVKSIEGNTCHLEREGLPDLFKVRLNAVQRELSNHLTLVPKEGSVVQCAIIENREEEAFIIGYSEIEKLTLGFEDNTFQVDGTGVSVSLDDGKIEIKNSSEDLKTILTDLLDAINRITVTTATGPSGVPINMSEFSAIKNRLSDLFKG